MNKKLMFFLDLLLLFIITAPAFFRILSNQYFLIHDDQHIVRLFLLDQGINQGYSYPRWVGQLGFGFGYPLFNFYPPFIYYIGELFHRMGFSLIWSIKLLVVGGFYVGALGMFVWVKKYIGKIGGYVSATLYTFFFYHAVLVYVRGAFAEFIALSILPFIFLMFDKLFERSNAINAIYFGITLAILVLTQPLVAIPAVFFLFFFFVFYFYKTKNRLKFTVFTSLAIFIGLTLSSFFWLPSMVERKYTLIDKILTGELASFKLHYILPSQFWYSLWGYGGSGPGLTDGMTFQLGKIHIALVMGAIILSFIYFYSKHIRHSGDPDVTSGDSRIVAKNNDSGQDLRIGGQAGMTPSLFCFFVFLLLFSLFMTTEYSSFIWDRVKYLWYLQFPWRFLTFTAIFISVTGGYSIYFLFRLFNRSIPLQRWSRLLFSSILILATIVIYQKYFRPERFISTTDKERTSYDEIAWRISRTSYEFVPKGVKTKKSELNTTILAIDKQYLQKKPFTLTQGEARVRILEDRFQNKTFFIDAKKPIIFRLNTYNFPGWKAYLNGKEVPIEDKNDFKLQTIQIPAGKYKLNFVFEDTPIRNFANMLTFIGFVLVTVLLILKFKKEDS